MTVVFFMIFLIPANAQDKGQKKMHVVIEENGIVVTDTSVFFDKDVSEQDIAAAISGITGENNHPCQAQNQPPRHCDTVVYKCKHMQKSEIDSLLEVSGKTFTYTQTDTCRHAEGSHGPGMNHTEKVAAGQEPCRPVEKEIIRMGDPGENETVIIEEDGDIIIRNGNRPGEKCIKVIVESDGDTAVGGEKQEIRIIKTHDKEMTSPEGCEKKVIEKKIIVTEEGDKAEKTIILESPAETEKKSKKEH
jgi:hypothetical protein